MHLVAFDGLIDDVAARMEPGDALARARRQRDVVNGLPAAKADRHGRAELIKPLSAHRRYRNDVIAPLRFAQQALALVGVEQVDLVPGFEPRRRFELVEPE